MSTQQLFDTCFFERIYTPYVCDRIVDVPMQSVEPCSSGTSEPQDTITHIEPVVHWYHCCMTPLTAWAHQLFCHISVSQPHIASADKINFLHSWFCPKDGRHITWPVRIVLAVSCLIFKQPSTIYSLSPFFCILQVA